jgi:hypothetical protein
MDLFSTNQTKHKPIAQRRDGELWQLDACQAIYLYLAELLENIDWKNDQAIIFGKLIITKRKLLGTEI